MMVYSSLFVHKIKKEQSIVHSHYIYFNKYLHSFAIDISDVEQEALDPAGG